jgi:putative phosphonate metabolism protein
MSARYAVYFSPASHSPWWTLGSRWLGRDESTGESLAQPLFTDACPEDFQRITAEPRRYGFHATLKAPFRLAQGLDEAALLARMQVLAKTLKPLTLSPLGLASWDGFVALVPQRPSTELLALAAACVTELDDLRAPLTADELARRTPGLDARGLALLAQFGYPHVLERMRLHFTLTGRVALDTRQWVESVLRSELEVLNAQSPLVLDRLCLFAEYQPGAAFLRIADVQVAA